MCGSGKTICFSPCFRGHLTALTKTSRLADWFYRILRKMGIDTVISRIHRSKAICAAIPRRVAFSRQCCANRLRFDNMLLGLSVALASLDHSYSRSERFPILTSTEQQILGCGSFSPCAAPMFYSNLLQRSACRGRLWRRGPPDKPPAFLLRRLSHNNLRD